MQRYQRPNAAPTAKKKPRRSSKRSRLKRIALTAAVILVLLLPTGLAIGSYIYVKNAPVDNTETYYTSVNVLGTNSSATFSPDKEPELFQCFIDMLEEPNPVSNVEPGHSAYYSVTFHTNTGQERYTFHFSPTDSRVYFTNSSGSIYHVTNDSGTLFLNSHYSYEIYPQAVLPSLQDANADIIRPSEVNWSSRTPNGDFLQLQNTDVEPGVADYGIADNFVSFLFQNDQSSGLYTPDDCQLTITRNGAVIYDAPIKVDNLAVPLNLPELLGNELFTIHAEYYQKSEVSYYGTLIYRFTMSTTEPAVFAMQNNATATEGGFFLFTAQNAQNINRLLFFAERDGAETAISPIIFKKGDQNVYALIPAQTIGAGNTLTVKYGSKTESFSLTQTPLNTINADSVLQSTPPALAELIAQLGATQAEVDRESDVFAPHGQFAAQNGTLLLPFGSTSTENEEVTLLPFELYAMSGDVTATAWGRVKAVGSHESIGQYVIVDHGCGIYTWYCGLSQSYVKEGEIVSFGDRLGRAGRPNFCPEDTDCLLMMTTIGKVAVDPAYLRDFNFQFGD